jgi:SAM-dependent methyltransferase
VNDVDPRLREHRDVWERKPGLRAIYADYHRRLLSALPKDESILEIGGGSGNFSEATTNVISIDLMRSPWIDIACDAHALPFRDGAFGGIAMLDVLHHLVSPATFFEEAARVLRPGGRLAMIEPGITLMSWPFYNFLHQEPVDMSVDPLADQPPDVAADPFLSNQGIPTLLFDRQHHRTRFEAQFPNFTIIERQRFSLFAYPLSGGFKRWSLLPGWVAPSLLRMENYFNRLLGPILGFRTSIVLERL